MCQKISKRIASMFVVLIAAFSFICAPEGYAGDSSLRLAGIDIQLGMSKAELQKRLLGKYTLLVLPERPGKPSMVTIIDQDAKTTVGNVYFENNRVVSVSRKAYDSNKSDAVRLADLLRVAFTEMLAGKQIDVVAVSLSTHRDPKGYSVDYLSFGFGNRIISINVSHGIENALRGTEREGVKFEPEVLVLESLENIQTERK